jgi:hypothetical protein
MSSHYNWAWARSVNTEVRTTQNLHGDTRLFEVKSSEVVWSAATTTATGWDSVPVIVDQFARLIVDTLKKDAVISRPLDLVSGTGDSKPPQRFVVPGQVVAVLAGKVALAAGNGVAASRRKAADGNNPGTSVATSTEPLSMSAGVSEWVSMMQAFR